MTPALQRLGLLLVLAVTWAACSPSAPPPGRSSHAMKGLLDCKHSAVGILNASASTSWPASWPAPDTDFLCTATYIGNGYAVTAAHCCVHTKVPRGLYLRGRNYPLDTSWPLGGNSHAYGGCRIMDSYCAGHSSRESCQSASNAAEDYAIVKLQTGAGATLPEDPSNPNRIAPMTVATWNPLWTDDIALVVGHSDTSNTNNDDARRMIYMSVYSDDGSYMELHSATDGFQIFGGDSGGPTLVEEGGTERILAVNHGYGGTGSGSVVVTTIVSSSRRTWINNNCANCLGLWTPPTTTYVDDKSPYCASECTDVDGDGVLKWEDNCPTVANADQANCGASSYAALIADMNNHGKPMGDACDPTPCVHRKTIASVNKPLPYSCLILDSQIS